MLIKNMIEDLGSPGEEPIPIMNVSNPTAPCKNPPATDTYAPGLRERPQEGARVVLTAQERPGAHPGRRRRLPQEDHRH
jgi:hypothetical protein